MAKKPRAWAWGTTTTNPYGGSTPAWITGMQNPTTPIWKSVAGAPASGPAVRPSSPTTPTIPGFTPPTTAPTSSGPPDLYQMALNSPWYQQVVAANNAAAAADAANRKSSIQTMLTQFGLVPQGFQDKYGDIDNTTRGLIDANTKSGISTVARMKEGLTDELRSSSRRLASKGLRRSGARGYNMRRSQMTYDRNFSDAISKLLGSAQSTYSGFASGEYNRQLGLSSALANAINQMSNYYNGFSPGGQQTNLPSWSQANPGVAPPWQAGSLLQPGKDYGTLI
jgi:hypothetical protein